MAGHQTTMFTGTPMGPWTHYAHLATLAEQQDGVSGLTAGLHPAKGTSVTQYEEEDNSERGLGNVDAVCFPGFDFPPREGFAIALRDDFAGAVNASCGKELRGACRDVEEAGRIVTELEAEVVAVRARHAQLRDLIHQTEQSLTSLSQHAIDWQRQHRLPSPTVQRHPKSHHSLVSDTFVIPTNPVLSLFPSYRKLVHTYETANAALKVCKERTTVLRGMIIDAQNEFIKKVLEVERVGGAGGSCQGERGIGAVRVVRKLPRSVLRRNNPGGDRRVSQKHDETSEVDDEDEDASPATDDGEKPMYDFNQAPTVPPHRVREALDAMRAFREHQLHVIRAMRRGGRVEKNLRRLQHDITVRMRKTRRLEQQEKRAAAAANAAVAAEKTESRIGTTQGTAAAIMMAMAAKTAEATARATRELERRIKARDERAIQILEKLRREQAIGERLEAQNAAATNTGTAAGQAKKRKKRNKKPPPAIMPGPVPMIIKIDSDNHSTQAISLAVPPPPLAGGTAAGPTTTSVSPKPPQPRRALPVPHHVITPHPAPSLSVGTNSFTATPALIFPDFDHDTKPFMQRITLTLTNTSGMTNTVRFHHLDQHLKDKGVSVAWAPVSGEHEHPEAKVVPGRLSPGRGAKMIVKLNVKTALKVDESGQDHADLTGYVWFEAHVGGVFSVPIQATRGRSRVEIVRDLNSSGDDSVRVGECLVGGSGSAVIRVANRGIVDTEISVECEKSNISGENVFSVRGDEATGAATVVIPGYATNTIIPLKFTPSTPGVHTSRIKIKDVKTGKKICSVPIRGDAMPPPLSVPPKTSVGTLAMSSGSVGDNSNNTAVSVGLVLKNTSTSCIHVKVLPVPTHPAVEISVSPTTVAVHRGVFRVSVRVAPLPAIPGGASHGGPFSIPLRFKYELSSGNWGFVETLVEGIATRLELDAPTKGVKAPDCTVWDSGVDMFVPIENLGVVDQIVECRVSHPGVLQLATIIGIGDDQSSDSERSIASAAEGKASPHQLVRIGKGQQVQGAALKMTIGPGSKIRIPLTFHPRAWASGSGDVRNTRGGGGGGGARGPHSTSTRRTTPYLTLTTAHQTYRVPIHVAPTRPVLRFQPGAITTTAVARGSSRDVAATLVRCRTVAEEKRGDEGPLDEVRYTIGSAEAVDGITVDAGVASQGEVHLGELTLQLRVDVDEEVFAKRKEQEVTVPVRFERTSAVSGAVTSSVAAFIIRVPVVEPDIWTTATKISLGPLARGVRTVHGIPISNNSDEAAAVTLWLISGDADSFFAIENGEIISDSSRKGRVVMIEPDQTAELPIAFQPTKAGPCSSIWECASECTQVRVTVDGRGVVPVVAWGVMDVVDDFAADDDQQQQQKVKEEEQMQLVQPELIMFRDLGLGDIAIKKILIRNGGDEDVEVFIALEGTGAPASPFSLSANAMKATLTVPVVASSTSTQAIAGRATSPAARSTSATATAADPAPTPAPAAPTTQTLTIPARCTKSIPLTFLPTCENDHFSTTLTISCPGAPTTSARVVGRCWDTSTAVIGYDVQPEGMRDGPWDIPPAVFIQHHCHDLKLDNTSSTDSDTEQEVDDDESDYAKSGPTVPPPTPAEPPATTPSSLMQELDLLRPVELETMHYGMLHLKWARHPSGTGYILPATSSFLTLVNMRPPPLRETGPAEQLHGGVKIGAGGKATMQTPAEKQAAKAAKKLAGGAKAPPVVPADFVVDRYDTTLKYYPSLGVYYPDMSGNDEDDIVGPDALKIVVEGSEGTVEQGGERKIRICVARANAPDASKPHTADNKAPSAASVTPAAAVAAPMKRANSSKKRDTNKDQPPTTDPSAAVPAAAVAAPTPDPPVPNPVKLESCFKVTLNGGLKLGTGIMPATENRVWILGIVIDGVEEEAK